MLKEYIAQVITERIYQNVWNEIHNLKDFNKIDDKDLSVIDEHIYTIALITTKELLIDVLENDKEINY